MHLNGSIFDVSFDSLWECETYVEALLKTRDHEQACKVATEWSFGEQAKDAPLIPSGMTIADARACVRGMVEKARAAA